MMLRSWPRPLYAPDAPGGSSPAASAPSTGAPPDGGASPPGGAPAPAAAAPSARPEYIPEQFWDTQSNAVKTDEFGKHYSEIAAFHSEHAPKIAALVTRKPEDIKFEVVLPKDVKVPEGLNFDPANDPRQPFVRSFAQKHGLTQEAVNELVAYDAQLQIADVVAHNAAVEESKKQLGSNYPQRKAAVDNYLSAKFTGDEKTKKAKGEALQQIASSAVAFEAIEDLVRAGLTTGVPGHAPESERPSNSQPKSLADRIWPGGFNPSPQARAS